MLTCQHPAGLLCPDTSVGLPVGHSGPHRSCDRCGPLALSPELPRSASSRREAGSRSPAPVSGADAPSDLPQLPGSPRGRCGALRAGPAGFPAQRGDPPRHAELCRPEERSGGGLRLWRVAGGIDGREELYRAQSGRVVPLLLDPQLALLFRGWGEGQRAERARSPDTGLPVPTSRAQSRLSDLSRSHTTALRRPSLASSAAGWSPCNQGPEHSGELRDLRSLPDRRCHRGIDPSGGWGGPAAPGCRERG